MLVGIIIIIIGICCLIENLGINLDWGILISCLFLFSAIFLLIKDKKISMWNILLFIVGIWNLLLNLRLVSIELGEFLWPIIIIIIGLSIVVNKLKNNTKITQNNKLIYSGIFGGISEKIVDNKEHIVVRAVFGGVTLDLTNADIKNDINIQVYSIFGGVDLLLSDEYNIVVSSTSIFGGLDNKHNNKKEKNKKNINIKVLNIFGGTDLK